MAKKSLPLYIGLDIGGTKIAGGLISGGKILKRVTRPTEAKKSTTQVLKNIYAVIDELGVRGVKTIGIGIAGFIDGRKGVVLSSPNFAKTFSNVPLASLISKKYRTPTVIDNDANCFTLAEALAGSGRGHRRVVGITIGTGVGGGIVIAKKLYRGRDGIAGEVGHTLILQTGGHDRRFYHLEALASGSAIIAAYRQRTGKRLDSWAIEKLAIRGDKNAKAAYEIAQTALAAGITNIVNLLNPDVVVLGGGMARVRILTEPAIAQAKLRYLHPKLKTTKITVSKLKDAGVLGAALLAAK